MSEGLSYIDAEVQRGEDPDALRAYKEVLRCYLERDGQVTPMLAECPAASQLVEDGEAVWITCLTLGLPQEKQNE